MKDTTKLIGLGFTIIVSTVGALGWFSANIEKAIASHGEHPHKPTAVALEKLADVDASQNRHIAKLEHVPDDVAAIRARIDFLIESELDKAKTSAPHMRRMKRAARKVRINAPSHVNYDNDDPLAGLEGL